MKIAKIKKQLQSGRMKAIVKEIAGRRMLIGFERNNARSRKSRVKYFSDPIDLAALTANPNK